MGSEGVESVYPPGRGSEYSVGCPSPSAFVPFVPFVVVNTPANLVVTRQKGTTKGTKDTKKTEHEKDRTRLVED